MQMENSTIYASQRDAVTETNNAAALAHDIRNILTPALLSAEALSSGFEKNNHHTDRIYLAIDKTVDLCRETINGAATPFSKPSALCQISEIVTEAIGLSAPHRPSQLAISVSLEGDDEVILDRSKVLRIIFNLLKNAVNAIRKNPGRIRIEVSAENGLATVHVRDDGPGIPLEVLDRLFPSLVDGKTYSGRIGMGLSLTAQAAASIGGELILRSTSPKGTHFLVEIPYRAVTAEMKAVE